MTRLWFVSLRGWVAKANEIAEQVRHKLYEAEVAARQLNLFGDDGT